jgi:hypothetical protein
VTALAEVEVVAHVALEPPAHDGVLRRPARYGAGARDRVDARRVCGAIAVTPGCGLCLKEGSRVGGAKVWVGGWVGYHLAAVANDVAVDLPTATAAERRITAARQI